MKINNFDYNNVDKAHSATNSPVAKAEDFDIDFQQVPSMVNRGGEPLSGNTCTAVCKSLQFCTPILTCNP